MEITQKREKKIDASEPSEEVNEEDKIKAEGENGEFK